MSQHSTPRYPEEPSERELYLSELANSDENAEALLSGGADVDDLIAAGVLDDYEPNIWGWRAVRDVVLEEKSVDKTPMSLKEFEALMERGNWFLRRGYLDAPDQPH